MELSLFLMLLIQICAAERELHIFTHNLPKCTFSYVYHNLNLFTCYMVTNMIKYL